jgi:hypothetical protein
MRWKDLVIEYLYRKQGGRCLDCGSGVAQLYTRRVEHRVSPDLTTQEIDIDSLKLVHQPGACISTAIKQADLKAIQTYYLLERGLSPATIAEALSISERTVYRYARQAKEVIENVRPDFFQTHLLPVLIFSAWLLKIFLGLELAIG